MPAMARVVNIHRIADLLRGAVIEPGQTFSVNQYVGPRTAAHPHPQQRSDLGGDAHGH